MEDYTKYWHPKFNLVGGLIQLLYELDDCGCGGCCHIVVDDDNLYDDCLDFVIEYCEREENKDCIDRELSSTICTILKQMTFTQRAILFEHLNDDYIGVNLDNEICLATFLELHGLSIEEIVKKYDHRNTFTKDK